MSKNTRNRILLTALAALLLVTLTIGGTIAWLVDTTGTVTNTFAPADIAIKLEETQDGPYQLIPGKEWNKNPTVTVFRPETDVDIYLFVEIQTTATNIAPKTVTDYLSFTNNLNSWNLVEGDALNGVWYKAIPATESPLTNLTYELIGGNTVTVNQELTADDTNDAEIVISYTAYAIQQEGFTSVQDAWAKAKTFNPDTDGSTLDTVTITP